MRRLLALSLIALAPLAAEGQTRAARPAADPHCASDNGGIVLARGFCATVFADSLGGPRHLTVAPNGDVFVALQGGRSGSGGVIALRDTDGDGRADVREKFGDFRSSEVALVDGHLYAENTRAIFRFPIAAGSLKPSGPADTVVRDLPGGGHSAKTFVIAPDGALYVNVGSRTNSCQEADRKEGSRGVDPCTELETRAGIWKFDPRKLGQTQATGEHFASGIRNAVGIAWNPSMNALYVMQHGRDNLAQNWSATYNEQQSAESPGEEMFHVTKGADFGWPYCYYDTEHRAKLLAPDFGGDRKTVGRCAQKQGNVAVFPGHWAPNGLLFYTGTRFPSKYREGAFIAFHGSWNRAPLPQGGYKVVFQPMKNGRASGAFEIFADGFAPGLSGDRSAGVNRRPMGLAQGPDGALYITDDSGGRIWKVVYTGR